MPTTDTTPVPEKRKFSADEVATMLGVNTRTVYNMVERGELGSVKAGRSYVFYQSHLLELAGSEEVLNDMIAELKSDE